VPFVGYLYIVGPENHLGMRY